MSRIHQIAILLLFSLFISPITSSALDPNRAITQYVVDVWNQDKGLPNSYITRIVQTPDGYLWLATYGGVVRFDGVRFKSFDSSVSSEIPTAQCNALLISRDGTLWIGTYSKGLLAYKNGKFRRYTQKDGLSDDRIVEIYEDRSGNLWLGTPTGAMKMKDNKFTTFGSKEGLPAHIWSIREDHTGTLWAGSIGGGLFQFKNNTFVPYVPITEKLIYCFLKDSKRNFWIGTATGLYKISNGSIHKYSTPDLAAEKVINLLEDRKGNIWISTVKGLSRFWQDKFESFTAENGFPGKAAGELYEDAEENLWIASSETGLIRLHDGKFITYSKEEGLAGRSVSSIAGSKDGSVWIAHGSGISNLRNGEIKNFLLDPEVTKAEVITVMEDSAGTVWVGTEGGGLHVLKNDKLILHPESGKLLGRSIRTLYEDQPNSLWLALYGSGVNHIESGKLTGTFQQNQAQISVAPRVFHKDNNGSLLVLTEDGVNRLENGRFAVYIPQQLLVDHVWTIYRDSDDVLWMGSNGGGLKRYEKGKVVRISKNDGLFSDIVADILEDANGIFWVTSDKGIFSVSKKELNEFATGKIRKVRSKSYGKADGLKSPDCDYGFQPASLKTPDGNLWFPTFDGAAMIDPLRVSKNSVPPPIKIEEFSVDDKTFAAENSPHFLDPGRKRFEFRYTALSFRVPERVTFRYKLEGYDQDWQQGDTRRVASYTNLSPGSYRFRVIGSNDDGVWNENGASLSFHLKPFFYQTKWFYGLLVLSAFSIGTAAYRLRVRTLKAREQHLMKVVEERTRELRQVNVKLMDAQDRITRLLESQPQAIENIPVWSESIAKDVAKVIGASSISVLVREDENFRSWSGEDNELIVLEDLQKVPPFALSQTEKIFMPVVGGTGEIYGALKISGKTAAWGETEKRLIFGFANQLGSTLEMQKMRKDLTAVREKMTLRIDEFHAKGISTVQVCCHCSRCFDESAAHCPVDGAALRVPQILPYRIFDRYRMVRFLGQGGTGIVFQAEDEKLHRRVAVKILRKEIPDDPSQQNRWEREARTIARLHHPGIVSLYDIGELEDGAAFLIMEFLQGVDMSRKLRVDGPGTPGQVSQLIEQVGDALKCAHESSVIHRDLKPANLFMTASAGNSFQMKVVDFGLAKSLNEEQRTLTMTGVLIGSPSYMSPEQIRGQKLDYRSDLFSFAAVIYELLTGEVAFSAQAVPDVLVRILVDAPQPISAFIKNVPSEIQRTFDWALEKDPEKRPGSVTEWAREIAPLLKTLDSSVSGWNLEHLTSEIPSPSDPHSRTAQI
jgi:ligand-binding sensor domain-containing protein/tRNA A-37 threonylcarbamoyl transferase component Bud32